MPRLLEALALARGDGRYAWLLKAIGRVQLLILDDWGLAPLTGKQHRDLLEIMDGRHGCGSTIVTSQVPVDRWHEVIVDSTIADAVLDRLVHNASPAAAKGRALRKQAAKAIMLDAEAITGPMHTQMTIVSGIVGIPVRLGLETVDGSIGMPDRNRRNLNPDLRTGPR